MRAKRVSKMQNKKLLFKNFRQHLEDRNTASAVVAILFTKMSGGIVEYKAWNIRVKKIPFSLD